MKMNFYDKMRREAPTEGAAAATDSQAASEALATQSVAADPGPDLSFIPADYHVDGKPDLGKFAASYQEIVARDAQRAEADAAASALVPEGDYDFALPEGLTFEGLDLPEGFKVDIMADNEAMKPLFSDLSGVLKELKAPQEAAGKLLGLLAKHQATQYSQAITAQRADLGRLGSAAQVDARISTVARVLDARLPSEEAAALKAMVSSGKALQALERLIGPSRGAAPQTAPPAKVDDLAAYYATPTK